MPTTILPIIENLMLEARGSGYTGKSVSGSKSSSNQNMTAGSWIGNFELPNNKRLFGMLVNEIGQFNLIDLAFIFYFLCRGDIDANNNQICDKQVKASDWECLAAIKLKNP